LWNTQRVHEGVSKSFRTGRLQRELQMLQLSAIVCNCIAILWVSLVSFAAITLCVASQRVFIVVVSLSTQSGNFWIQPRNFYMNSLRFCLWHCHHVNLFQMITHCCEGTKLEGQIIVSFCISMKHSS
jgi:hypothetical protein